jgi:hypothetical protein
MECGRMKRILVCLLMLLGFVLAGCEKEVIREYPAEGPHREFRHGEYRLSNEASQNDGVLQVEAAVEP